MNLSSPAENNINGARQQIALAASDAAEAQTCCLRANAAGWDSPAAELFSRWLASLVTESRSAENEIADLRAAALNV